MTANRVREADFQKAVLDLAHIHRWRAAHFRPAQTQKGWRTPVSADGKGFPDLVLVSRIRARSMFRELKAVGGKLSAEQELWLEDLEAAGLDAGVWTPADWPRIEEELAS